ncbi:MAG TPA: hypothetical protein ENN53_01115 [Candidatus Acetothermia bacterium]|nr:hypothetical protein [Candidatus Acetothermia bacterium]
MTRFLSICCSVLVAGAWIGARASPAGEIEPGLGWTYRAEVTDLARDVIRTTTLAFLGVGDPQGRHAVAVITDRDWGTTLRVYPVAPGADLTTAMTGPAPVVLRWPTVLDFVPELRGAMPPVQGFALPAVPVAELEWSLSFRQLLGEGAVKRGEIRLALGPQGAATVPAGTFAGLYSTTYYASWGRMSHEGMAWWPGEEGMAGPVWSPVWAQGIVGATVRYTWELVERVVLDAEELRARLREALSAMEKTDPAGAREVRDTVGELGIEVQ